MDVICRFCSSDTDLVHVFNDTRANNLNMVRYITLLATGIEIKECDIVSKMVCHKCCEIAIKLYKYRTKAVANDKLLKEKCGQFYTPPVVNQEEILYLAAKIASEKNVASNQDFSKIKTETENSEAINECNAIVKIEQVSFQEFSIPKLPEAVSRSASPSLSLESCDFYEWYAEQANDIEQQLTDITIKTTSCDSTSNPDNSKTNTEQSGSLKFDSDCDSERREDVTDSRNSSNISSTPPILPKLTFAKLIKNATQKIKKKPGRKPNSSKKRPVEDEDDDADEVIPQKKIRSFGKVQVQPKRPLNKIELPNHLPNNRTERKAIFTSSLELAPSSNTIPPTPSPEKNFITAELHSPSNDEIQSVPLDMDTAPLLLEHADCQNILVTEKSLTLFICSMCNLVCDSQKELEQHEKRMHLVCKYCKMKMLNINTLNKHLRDTCVINIAKNQPDLVLTKVDLIPALVRRYPETFEDLKASIRRRKNFPKSLEIVFEEHQLVVDRRIESASAEVVSLSSDDEDEVICIEVTSQAKSSSDVEEDQSLSITPSSVYNSDNLNNLLISGKSEDPIEEKETIHSIFKEYDWSTICEIIPDYPIRCSDSNSVIMTDFFQELESFEIPINFGYNSNLSASFQKHTPAQKPRTFNWEDKKVVDVQNPSHSFARRTTYANKNIRYNFPNTSYQKNYSNSSTPAIKVTSTRNYSHRAPISVRTTPTNKPSSQEPSTVVSASTVNHMLNGGANVINQDHFAKPTVSTSDTKNIINPQNTVTYSVIEDTLPQTELVIVKTELPDEIIDTPTVPTPPQSGILRVKDLRELMQ